MTRSNNFFFPGHDVVIATNIKIEKKSDFTIDRECVVQCHYHDFVFKLKNVQKEHEGIYNWRVKESGKDQIRQGIFYLCVNGMHIFLGQREIPMFPLTLQSLVFNAYPKICCYF
jgi:hypothetical protein